MKKLIFIWLIVLHLQLSANEQYETDLLTAIKKNNVGKVHDLLIDLKQKDIKFKEQFKVQVLQTSKDLLKDQSIKNNSDRTTAEKFVSWGNRILTASQICIPMPLIFAILFDYVHGNHNGFNMMRPSNLDEWILAAGVSIIMPIFLELIKFAGKKSIENYISPSFVGAISIRYLIENFYSEEPTEKIEGLA